MNSLLERVELALDEIRPHLQVDGGDIEVVEITPDFRLIVKWMGNCEMCNIVCYDAKRWCRASLKAESTGDCWH